MPYYTLNYPILHLISDEFFMWRTAFKDATALGQIAFHILFHLYVIFSIRGKTPRAF
jgi:hypothetical protein